MKRKTMILGIALIITLLMTSMCIRHLSKAAALRVYRPLDGVTIVVDAGHGGKDSGTRSGDIEESALNLAIAKKLQERLQSGGAKVIMTRSEDKDLASAAATNRKKEDMQARIDIINDGQSDLFISIHMNAYTNPEISGGQVFYREEHEVCEMFAKLLQKQLKKTTATKMHPKSADYYILKHAKTVGALVECGFLSNPSERKKLVQENYQEQLAQALYNGILEYFQILS